jgi:hypothetical protein
LTKPIVLTGGDLQLIFEWHVDRYAHRVVVSSQCVDRPWLASFEATDESHWPASPPLQQVHVESRSGGIVVALAVGMAGRSHWSAAFELDPNLQRIACDVACRVTVAAERLGSVYRVSPLAGWSVSPHDDAVLNAEGEQIAIQPRECPATAPATIRWRYQLLRQ